MTKRQKPASQSGDEANKTGTRRISRRALLCGALCSPLASTTISGYGCAIPVSWRKAKATDICVIAVEPSYEEYRYRSALKFGGRIVDGVTQLNVKCKVRTRLGRTAEGFGSMPLSNVWSFPSKVLSDDETLSAMKVLAERIAKITADFGESGHPIDLNRALEPHYLRAVEEVSSDLKLAEPIPKLCTLVTASPFDAAIHDAFGKVHELNCYHTYGPEFMVHDLDQYLGPEFKGERLNQYITEEPKLRMPVYHLVGALDPITDSDLKQRLNDGLPETLPEWINYNGLTHLKIKLNGDDLKWDVERVVRVERVTAQTQRRRGVREWVYSLDFNERCPNVDYVLEFLRRVGEAIPEGFQRIQYIEQPTARELKREASFDMHEAAKLVPIVIDESLTDLESLRLARELGYSGAALKACKGQSSSLLLAAAVQKYKMFRCVQDLTCPGASLIHSAGLAAHIPGVAAIEANARQYVPAANKAWEAKFPGIFRITDGTMDTSILTGPGLGAV